MDVTVSLTGLKEAQRALYAYSRQLGDRVVLASLRQGANLVLRQARANAPVRTGLMKRALVVKRSKIYNGRRMENILGLYLSLRKGPAYYGKFQESGWRAGSKNTRQIPGKRFVQRAFQSQQDAAARLISQSALRGAEIVARRTGLK